MLVQAVIFVRLHLRLRAVIKLNGARSGGNHLQRRFLCVPESFIECFL